MSRIITVGKFAGPEPSSRLNQIRANFSHCSHLVSWPPSRK